MSHAIRPKDSFGGAARRAALVHLDAAREAVASGRDDTIHEVRRSLKRLRALLRLVAPELSRREARTEKKHLRDLAKRLSSARDTEALVEALDRLVEAPGVDPALGAELRSRLIEARDQARARSAIGVDLAAVDEALVEVRRRVKSWPLKGRGFGALEKGLESTYRDARCGLRDALDTPSVERLHEWRKHVKAHSEHLRFLQPLWPRAVKPIRDVALELGEMLGQDHDFAMLAEAGDDAVRERAERRRAELVMESFATGGRLFADRPRAFVRRVRAWADVWRAEHPAR